MRLVSYLSALAFSLLLLISTQSFRDYMATFVRNECQNLMYNLIPHHLERPSFAMLSEITLTKYRRMKQVRLQNQGGYDLFYCDGFNFPAGLKVTLTADGHSCEISGVPSQAQASTNAYIVAANQRGRAVAVVEVGVNALVLQE